MNNLDNIIEYLNSKNINNEFEIEVITLMDLRDNIITPQDTLNYIKILQECSRKEFGQKYLPVYKLLIKELNKIVDL
jgi:hypothetical protein